MFLGELDDGRAGELAVPFAFVGVRLFGRGASVLRVRLSVSEGTDGALSLLALDETGTAVLSVRELQTRAIDVSQLRAVRPVGHDTLYELQWVGSQGASVNGSRLRVALLGDGGAAQLEEDLAGAQLERYMDLAALEEAIEGGSETPAVVLVDVTGLARDSQRDGRDSGEPLPAEPLPAESLPEGSPPAESLPEGSLPEGSLPEGSRGLLGGDAGQELADSGRLAGGAHELTARTLGLLQAWVASERLVRGQARVRERWCARRRGG